MISFNSFCRCKTNRYLCLFCVIFNQMYYCMNTTMHCSIMIFFITKILPQWFFLIFCNVKCMFYDFIDSFILCR